MSHPPKKLKSSDSGESDEVESGSYKKLNYRDFKKFRSPVLADEAWDWLGWLRDYTDFCMTPIDKDDDDPPIGGIFTKTNADKDARMRNFAESCLKFYNEAKETNFKLVKVWKANVAPMTFNLTFTAQEDGIQEQPFFRGAVRCLPKPKPVFCEIKAKNEVTLLPTDEGYAQLQNDSTK